jgi:hypothetical protein
MLKWLRGRNASQRVGVIESVQLDGKRSIKLVLRDNIEHLVLVGGRNDVVIEPNIVRQPAPKPAHRPASETRGLPPPGVPAREPLAGSPPKSRQDDLGERGDIFAALEVSGVMRSTDGGESWSDCSADLLRLAEAEPRLRSKLVSDTEAEGMLDGHAVCTSAADPDSIIVAVRMGLFRSEDQGKTWQDMRVDRFSPFTYGRDIKVSPEDPNTLYACLSVAASSKDGALYRSQDVGKTWQRFDKVTPHGTLMSVGLHHGDAKQVYVAARYGEVFGTRDGGESWLEMPLPSGVQHIYALACG